MHKDSRFRDEEDSLLPDLRRARKEPFGSCQGSKSSLLENVETENCTKDKFKDSSSPYLGGVSRKEFWLIFGGVLAQYFVSAAVTCTVLIFVDFGLREHKPSHRRQSQGIRPCYHS